jgi:hypothetical protein
MGISNSKVKEKKRKKSKKSKKSKYRFNGNGWLFDSLKKYNNRKLKIYKKTMKKNINKEIIKR